MARWQPARADVITEYAREVLEVHPRGRVLVGLDGIEDPAQGTAPTGREAFAADLATALADEGVRSLAVPMGDFAAEPRATTPERFYDEARFRAHVLTPFRRGELAGAAGERAVLVVSGPFLHFGDLAGVWHTSAWLQLSRELEVERDAERLPGVDRAPWTTLIDLAFQRLDARKLARSTFDLDDPEHPRRRFEDAC
jgi:uridine kinase